MIILIAVIAVVAILVAAGRGLSRRTSEDGVRRGAPDGHEVRQVFQYLLLFGLVMVTAVGVAGLLGAALAQGGARASSDTDLARSVSFTVVGLPLTLGVGWWSRRAFRQDPDESRAIGWLVHLAAASLVSLLVALTAVHDVLAALLDLRAHDPHAVAQSVVWTGVWAFHWWLSKRHPDQRLLQPQHLLGSIIGLVLTMVGLGVMIAGTLRVWCDLDGGPTIVGRHEPVLDGAVTLLLGAVVWGLYWWAAARRSPRTPLWLAHVLLLGVGAGGVVALVAGSIALHRVAVWFVGDPWPEVARDYFDSMPATVAVALVGLLSLAYHRSLLIDARERSDVDRLRDYLLAAIGLGATTAGGTIVVVALIEGATDPTVLTGGGAANTVLAALTLLLVGTPVWWLSWRRGQQAASTGTTELTSPVRRIYLFSLLGVSSLAAVGALLVGAWVLVDQVLAGESAEAMIRSIRYPVGILVTTAVVAGYHWSVHLRARAHQPLPQQRRHDFVLLLGVADTDLAERIAGRTGATTWAWSRTGADRVWPEDDLLEVLAATEAREVLVIAEDQQLQAIPVTRHAPRG